MAFPSSTHRKGGYAAAKRVVALKKVRFLRCKLEITLYFKRDTGLSWTDLSKERCSRECLIMLSTAFPYEHHAGGLPRRRVTCNSSAIALCFNLLRSLRA